MKNIEEVSYPCMICGKESEINEWIYPVDEDSYKHMGWEVWFYCKDCNIKQKDNQ